MTPELKIACEVVFQEHKAATTPVAWNRDVFRGRLSTGMSEKAKETLVEKKVIHFPNPAKKNFTVLNPLAFAASNYTEAELMVTNPVPAMAGFEYEQKQKESTVFIPRAERPTYQSNGSSNSVTAYLARSVNAPRLVTITGKAEAIQQHLPKWYQKPLLVYIVWPLLAALAGGVIAYLIGEAYTGLMFDLKK